MHPTNLKIGAKIFLAMLTVLSTVDSHAYRDVPFVHWVGMFPRDFNILSYEDEYWTIQTYAKPSLDSKFLGSIESSYISENGFGPGMTAKFISTHESHRSVNIEPHLYDQDSGYGPYFHLTALEIDNGWVKVQLFKLSKPVWANFGAAFGVDNVAFYGLEENGLYFFGRTGISVEQYNDHALLVRHDQEADMWCGDETLEYEPYQTWLIDQANWIDEYGRSRFSVMYARGC